MLPPTISSPTSVYAGYQHNPPGIGLMGKKTWLPGKTLSRFITANLGIPEKEQRVMVERISDAVADTAPAVREMMDPGAKAPRTYTVTVTPTGTGTVTNPAPLTIVVTVQ